MRAAVPAPTFKSPRRLMPRGELPNNFVSLLIEIPLLLRLCLKTKNATGQPRERAKAGGVCALLPLVGQRSVDRSAQSRLSNSSFVPRRENEEVAGNSTA